MFDCLHRNPEGPCPLFCINRGTQGGRIDPLKIKFKTLIIQSKEPPLLLCHFLAQFFTTSTTFSVPQTIHFTCFKKHQEVKRDGADLHLQIPFLLFLAEEVPNPGEEMPRWEFAARQLRQPWARAALANRGAETRAQTQKKTSQEREKLPQGKISRVQSLPWHRSNQTCSAWCPMRVAISACLHCSTWAAQWQEN